jgi:hypothetical protein
MRNMQDNENLKEKESSRMDRKEQLAQINKELTAEGQETNDTMLQER